ncbi:tyrosinase [Lindgomyces ingoldianus]|uniref:Tyrosinase n=1 Tax=Lindgomyces ingoldianus TaxID=673940 RepID=A0ACB6QDU3_9PLEO|nr:tyrosinase [Lindgomyces ingoldianus]KAF2465062.1 tyrosinase [Lindgomyces ingoldianus]
MKPRLTRSTGRVPIRREVRDLQKNFPDQWNVYILGLRSFQMADQTDPVSFYQITGIHGRPYIPWQKAEGIPGKKSGYCPHSNTMFLSWHRAYLALYEQELYKHIQRVSLQFPAFLRGRYTSAADEFRIPYWDWALGDKGGSVPEAFTTPTAKVIGFNGQEQIISNPLHHYEFHPLVPGDFTEEWASINSTVRWPDSNHADCTSQQWKFIKNFNDQRRSFQDQVSQGFAVAEDMNSFSMHHLELVHGNVHYAIGGTPPDNPWQGHMWPLEYSAFEPLFMLHHCNVDRLFALWQGVNPDKYVEPRSVFSSGTYTIADNTVVDADTPLLPFWNTTTTFWTSNAVKDTTVLGYAYPETMSWMFDSKDAYRASVNASISQLYSSSSRARLSEMGAEGGDLKHLNADGSFTDWSINVEASLIDMPTTFTVRFSLVGMFSSDPVSSIGAWTHLMPSDHTMDRSTAKRDSTLDPRLKGTISLTATLLDDIAARKLESLDEGIVVPYLKSKLTWKVYAGNGMLIPHGRLQSLTVQVISRRVHIPTDPKLRMEYSDISTPHLEITSNKGGEVKA